MTVLPVDAVQGLQAHDALANRASIHDSRVNLEGADDLAVQQAVFDSLMRQTGTQMTQISLSSQDALHDEES